MIGAGRIIASVNREPMTSAAFRLKHDLGKAVRWNAPVRRETSPDDLRRRLARPDPGVRLPCQC